MASKAFPFFSIFFAILLSLLSHNYSVLSIEHLKGCQKGDKVKGIHELKKYPQKFGYLNYENSKLLESTIKTCQLNFNLKSTGFLGANTAAKMRTPRCGVADIVNGTTRMRSGKKKQQQNNHFHTVWPASKFSLTYAFRLGTRGDAITPVARAFQTWAANTQFRFSKIEDFAGADIKISFESRNHGDGRPFDGRGGPDGTLAHAFAPTNGRFHYGLWDTYIIAPSTAVQNAPCTATVLWVRYKIFLASAIAHELRVLLCILQYLMDKLTKRSLQGDDIQGIKALYNV
ncbi:matrix metalloproteinase-2 [Citrus sinensis]|uniref:Matrix metalloproteinase-2 n=1 Tax=Citrus sinensis TaxID=2711 RepID=A0ACB8K4N0_CITSI|nr:matrix metalloproteinase-2 [Citrus sinensis]